MTRPLLIDCPPFLKELLDAELAGLVPDLEVHVGEPSADEIAAMCAGRAFIVNDHSRFDAALLGRCTSLEAIIFLGTGAGSFIDLGAAAAAGITVRTVKGYGDRSVAEHAFAMMFAAARRIAEMDRAVRAGGFTPVNGMELLGKTLGVVGTGGIGGQMVRLAAAIGMEVLGWNRSGVAPGLPCRAVELDELLAGSDIVSLHLHLNEGTRGFLSAERLAAMKPGAILVNTARGAVVAEPALVEALRTGHLGHAALDVFVDEPPPAGHPLLVLENVTLTPHAAFMTREASINLLRMSLENLIEEQAKRVAG